MSTNPDEDQTYLSQSDTAFLSKARITDWETDKTFSTDWAGNHFFLWAELLHQLRDRPARILEIGSWEGRSALFFLNYLPLSRIVCIDPFEGNVEHQLDPYFQQLATRTEAQFDSNLAAFAGRVEKIKGSSTAVLPTLGLSARRFDLAYVDGSHMAADVYSDAVLTWSLVEPGGIVIFDDYEWTLMDHEHERPRLGSMLFLLRSGASTANSTAPTSSRSSSYRASDRSALDAQGAAAHSINSLGESAFAQRRMNNELHPSQERSSICRVYSRHPRHPEECDFLFQFQHHPLGRYPPLHTTRHAFAPFQNGKARACTSEVPGFFVCDARRRVFRHVLPPLTIWPLTRARAVLFLHLKESSQA